jgi:hypothetical protein
VISSSFQSRFDRRGLLITSAALGLGAVSILSRRALARQTDMASTLLVRGDMEIPSDAPMAWRVVGDVAELSPSAAFEQRATGFAVATELFSSLLLTDQATGSAYRLAPGEAAFVREGTWQRRESLGQQPVSYLRIGLVAATGAEDAGDDPLIFSGPAFDVPAGAITLALQRAEMAAGDAFGLPPGTGETLVLVEQGEVELEVGEAAPRERLQTVVGSGTSYAIRSVGPAAMLYGARDATNVLIATIG